MNFTFQTILKHVPCRNQEGNKYETGKNKLVIEKRDKKYHEIMTDIRTKISFKLIKSMLLCLRGSRTVF